MKLLGCIISILLLFSSCQVKDSTKKDDVAERKTDVSMKENVSISREDSILSDIKDILLNEARNWPVDFYVDTLNLISVKTLFSEQQGYKTGKSYFIKDKNSKEWLITISSYEFEDSRFTQLILEKHRLAYYDESEGNSEFMMGGVFFKVPYVAFNIDSTFYEITSASSPIGHIVSKSIERVRAKYNLSKDFEMPCE